MKNRTDCLIGSYKKWGCMSLIRIFCLCAGCFSCFSCFSAELTLSQCRDSAWANYPLIDQFRLLQLSENYTLSNISVAYLPQFDLRVQASWQSDVTSLPIQLPGVTIPRLKKDQYNLQMQLSQLIYDGKRTSSAMQIARARSEMSVQELQASMYDVYLRVDQLYFAILLLKEQLGLNGFLIEDLERNLEQVSTSQKFGTATRSDVDLISVTLIESRQQRINILSGLEKYCRMMSLLTGIPDLDAQSLLKPDASLPDLSRNNRPEMRYYAAAIHETHMRELKLRADNIPILNLFMQGAYGRPGMNMLSNDFEFGWMAGVRLSYSLGNLYTLKKSKLLLENERLSILARQHTFLFNTDIQLTEQQAELKRIYELMKQDDDIVRLRREVVRASEAKLKNGVVNINDLLRDISAANSALLQKSLHEIEALQVIWKMKELVNN